MVPEAGSPPIFDVLPMHAPGVLAHFHDIALPYEYAEVYLPTHDFGCSGLRRPCCRLFSAMSDRQPEFRAAWPHDDPVVHQFPSHSFWIRRIVQ